MWAVTVSASFEVFYRVPLGPLKIKKRSKSGVNALQQRETNNLDPTMTVPVVTRHRIIF
jgi:hypothetical protein